MAVQTKQVAKKERQPELREFRGNNYKAIFDCTVPAVLISGPAGCVTGETRLYDPKLKEHFTIRYMVENNVAPTVMTAIGPIEAGIPFKKGRAPIIRFVMESGRQIRVMATHRFLTPDGWAFSSCLSVGAKLLVSDLFPRRSIAGTCPTTRAEGDRRSMQKLRDSQVGCHHEPSSCDEQLQIEAAADRGLSALRFDARGHNHGDWLLDGPAETRVYSRSCRSFDLPSTQDCFDQLVKNVGIPHRVLEGEPSHTSLSSLSVELSHTGTFRPDEARPSGRHEEPMPKLVANLASSLLCESQIGLDLSIGIAEMLSAALACPGGRVPESMLSALQLSACSQEISSEFMYSVLWDMVGEIIHEGEEDYYDLHVPIAEHYLAEGFVNHNTGKSSAAISKLHLLCLHAANVRCAMIRKTRSSLTDSGMKTFEKDVNRGELHINFGRVQRHQRHVYTYPNGSEIVIGGMDDPAKVMSTDYDIVYVQEGTELDQEDWDALSTRLRNGVLPYQQLIADCNPSFPQHWLKRLCDAGSVLMLTTTHRDNPALYTRQTVVQDGGKIRVVAGELTERGRMYMERLDKLTGPRRARLRDGQWVQAEGMVYEEWNESLNVIDRKHLPNGVIPREWTRYISIDFGFQDPLVVQWWAFDEDKRAYLYREIVKTGTLVEDIAKDINQWCRYDKVQPARIICDHDAEPRAVLEKHLGRLVTPATKAVEEGIQLMGMRIRPAEDGRPRLFVLRDALINRDERMLENGSPIGFIEEVGGYTWADKVRKEIPEDKDNHSMDSARMLVCTLDKPKQGMAFRII